MDKKKELTSLITEFDGDFFEKDFKELELFFKDTKKWFRSSNYYMQYPVEIYDSFKLVHDYEYESYGDGQYTRYKLYGIRLETDKEFNDRIEKSKKASETAKKAAKQAKLNKEKSEKELFEKLKSKYGGK